MDQQPIRPATPMPGADARPVAPRHLARLVLFAFLLTFLAARIVVFLIMSRWAPNLFLHVGETHVHHLNYGIFLLSATGAFLLFARPQGRLLKLTAMAYAVGLALTFDEFGMWLHLGGGYWQRDSFDAITIVAALLTLIAVLPPLERWKSHHHVFAVIVLILLAVFYGMLFRELRRIHARLEPSLQQLEAEGPP